MNMKATTFLLASQTFSGARHSNSNALHWAMALALAVSVSLSSATVQAETPCDACSTSCDCSQCYSKGDTRRNLLYQSLDTVAGGIERLFRLNQSCTATCCSETRCDGTCVSASCGSGMSDCQCDVNLHPLPSVPPVQAAPVPTVEPSLHPVAPPRSTPQIRRTNPRLPSVPPLDRATKPSVPETPTPRPSLPGNLEPAIVEPATDPPASKPAPKPEPTRPTDSAPRLPAEMSQPRLVPTQPAQELPPAAEPSTPPSVPAPSEPSTDSIDDLFGAPTESPQPATPQPPAESNEKGSIFDALEDLEDLNDPFEEDARRLREPYRGIRPTGLRRSSSGSRVPYRSVYPNRTQPQQRQGASPRSANSTIGSGLRPAQHIEPLRPVNHEQPIGLQPLGATRVLAPYRASRH